MCKLQSRNPRDEKRSHSGVTSECEVYSDIEVIPRKRRIVMTLFTAAALCVLGSAAAFSQSADNDSLWLTEEWYFLPAAQSIVDPAAFLPKIVTAELHLKRYIREERFYELRKVLDDTLAVDAIFDRALMLTDGNVLHALLISTFAVMDHHRLGINVPLIGSVFIPLTFESDSSFRLRRTHLPKKLLDDNPRASDKDKLQHFFGSAFIAYATNSDSFGKWVGDLFELGEDKFVLGGRDDARDRLANERGREFGLRLLKEEWLLPSDILWPQK